MATTLSDMAPVSGGDATRRLLPFAGLIFFCYMTVGLPLAVLPIYVHGNLGYGPVAVGWVMAMQSVGTLLSRQFAGAVSDVRGPKVAVVSGALICSAAAVLYSVASTSYGGRESALWVLLSARAILGLGESLLITGALAWCIGNVGTRYTGRAMVWVGIAMFGAIGVGSPIGVGLFQAGGFTLLALISAALPIIAGAAAMLRRGIPPHHGVRLNFFRVVKLIWPFGVSLALSTFGFGTLFAFLGLYYSAHHWRGAPWGLASFGAAYTISRLLFGGLPDQLGGRKVASFTIPLQGFGSLVVAVASSPSVAIIGAAILGAGYSLTFPALGVEAVKRVPAQSRGAAMGAYVAFVDIGLGLTGPIAGLFVRYVSYPMVFLLGSAFSLMAWVAVLTVTRRRHVEKTHSG